jgi:small subunit ribosomal protein S20
VANHKSALKRVKQSEKRRLRNKASLSQMRTAIKGYRALLAQSKPEEATAALSGIYTVIDRSEKKGVIHTNAAARYKSRLAKALQALKQG